MGFKRVIGFSFSKSNPVKHYQCSNTDKQNWNCSGCSEITSVNNPWTVAADSSVTVSEPSNSPAEDQMAH